MSTNPDLVALKAELQSILPARFERLVAALVGQLIGVGIVIAKSGFQHGGDAGTAGRQGRRLRIETKRYSDTNPLGERELLGELEQACQRDPALELWVLGATTEAKEQLETSLFKSALKQGVPVLVIDWKPDEEMPELAALCAANPDVVEELAGQTAGDLARRIAPFATDAIDALRRELAAWRVGYDAVAESALNWLRGLWNSPAESVAALGQDAAGGAEIASINRASIAHALDDWRSHARADSPAILVGEEGMGKTWASLGWLVANAADLPIVLVIPSGLVTTTGADSAAALRELLGIRLHDVTGVRDPAFWAARVERMLQRPAAEGPAFLVMLDGMNQQPDAPWTALHRQLQARPYAGRVKVISSTRPMFFEDTLRHLRGLVVTPTRIDVGPYDDAPGGEFAQMLALRGLDRSQIRDELVPLARVPRLFELVVRLGDRFSDVERVTVHGLLWEYGRDTLGTRGGRAFSEREWREWLAQIAERFRSTGSPRFTQRELEQTAARPTLGPSDVFARLSDIIDGQVGDADAAGGVVLRPEIVAQALGAAVIAHLDGIAATAPDDVADELESWLDPISGFSERAEILRASVAILSDPALPVHPRVAGAIVAAWLSTQNLPENHRRDVRAVAPQIVRPLLFAIEAMTATALSSARDIAVEALRAVPRSDTATRDAVLAEATRWMRTISRGVEDGSRRSDEIEQRRAARMTSRIGRDTDGSQTILGLQVHLVARADGAAFTQVASLLEGYPLAACVDLFELATLHLAIRGRLDTWASLKWLVFWNVIDFAATATALQGRAEEILGRDVERGVEPRLRERTAALLLWLSADPAVERRAKELDPRLDAFHSYEEDYEAKPGTSAFMLERRHAEAVVEDTSLPAIARVRRLDGFWWDPGLTVSPAVSAELETLADQFEVGHLSSGRFRTAEDLELDRLEAALARGASAALARLARRRIEILATLADARPKLGDAAYDALLVGDDSTATILREARLPCGEADETDADEGVEQLLLQPQLIDLDAEAQVDALVESGLSRLFTNVNPFLKPLDEAAVDRLIQRHGNGDRAAVERLVELLSVMARRISESARMWLEALALDADFTRREAAFETLAHCSAASFGRSLLGGGWSWNDATNEYLAHYGSIVLMQGAAGMPFEQVAHRIAPWLVAKAARKRGCAPAEVRLAAQILDRVVRVPALEAPDPGSQLSVDVDGREDQPFSVLVTPGLPTGDGDPVSQINAAMNQDAREEASRRAVEVATSRIRDARTAGASLYLADVDADDLVPILSHADDVVDAWCEGMEARTPDFKRRVRLAEGFFLALTEAMLRIDVDRGTALWSSVRASMSTKYIGTAGIDRMILILLGAPADDRIDTLVREIVEPRVASNDDVLLDISIAAAAAGRENLLLGIAAEDRASGIAWRMERGKVLEAFAPGSEAPPAFPDGRGTSTEYRDAKWGERRYRDGAARHWWEAYWSAADGESAYSHWVLLEKSVDRRALEWIDREWPPAQPDDVLFHRKWAFAASRRRELKRAADDRDKKLDNALFDRDAVADLEPWTRLEPVNRS